MKFVRALLQKIYNMLKEDPLQGHLRRGLIVGKNFGLMEDVIIDYSHTWHIQIGDDVTLAPRVHILAHDASTKRHLGYTKLGKVTIGNRVFIGAGTIVLPGVKIGDDVIVGAGSLVSKDIESGLVVAGNPAKVITSTESYLEGQKTRMSEAPCFDHSYTMSGGVSIEMKKEMNKKMKNRIGYIV